jgi:hypothetical protein
VGSFHQLRELIAAITTDIGGAGGRDRRTDSPGGLPQDRQDSPCRRRRHAITLPDRHSGLTRMNWLITKYLITAAVVVLVSEAAKRSEKLGGFIAALPIVTVLVLIWLYIEKQPESRIANHAWYTFWYVLPTLPMFLLFPTLLPRLGFWPTLAASVLVTAVCFGLTALALRPFGIDLLP